ncbi:extensin-like isoform X2 [Acanthaster planci]|uniref:Extensin-like isoform X2 n=1 Tax=Acanthaster planci TaxID=133434 RepID=A0A8B7Z9U0_ACAPL|nr:extensin-like isoform X2 [Acanthaster planci]
MSKKLATYDDALYWTADEVGEWLQQVGFYEYVEPLQKHNIDGKELFELSENKLRRLYPNMPTGKSDPASMLWKQINKVKENRRTGKKSKLGFGARTKPPPKTPTPDYDKSKRQVSRDEQGSEEEGWGSDFSDGDGPGFEQEVEDVHPQGNTQGRAPSYNGSSTSSFTNLSSSASGKDDDSSMLYEAPNPEGDFDETYEVPTEQKISSYGDGDCDEIYDVPHEDEDDNLQPDIMRRPQPGGRSSSPLPPVVSPRHDPLRPLPTLPPPQPSRALPSQQLSPRHAPPMPQRPNPSPQHFQRQSELPAKQEEEQENYEVPCIEVEQPNYEAPIMDTQDEDEDPEEEYLVPVSESGGLMSPTGRPPAPLPPQAGSGMPPPRPMKPPELTISNPPLPDETLPPPIPTRPVVTRTPIESKGFSKVLPDPPPHVIREVMNRPADDHRRDRSPGRAGIGHLLSNGSRPDENRNFAPRPPVLGSTPKPPPPLPKNIPRDLERAPEVEENSGSGSGTISRRLQQFQGTTEETEPTRPPLLPRPQANKPDLSAKPNASKPVGPRPSWLNSAVSEGNSPTSNPPVPGGNKPPMPSPPQASLPAQVPPRPTPRSRPIAELPANVESKPTPPIPTKEPAKQIKKFTPHGRRQPELPKQIAKDVPQPPPPEPEQAHPAPKPMPQPPKRSEMTGYPWYDPDLSREEAVKILKESKMDGAFIVRNSSKGEDNIPYSLSLWYNNKVRNLHIRLRDDGKYALGTYKENEQVFDTAVLLIQHHMTTPLILAGDVGKTCLKVAAPNFR